MDKGKYEVYHVLLSADWRYHRGAFLDVGLLGDTACEQPYLYAVALLLIPVMVTGGIHLDGLLDTSDALHSYQSGRESWKSLRIPMREHLQSSRL